MSFRLPAVFQGVPSELDVLVIRKDNDQSHHDFRVRQTVVQEALMWVLENNKYYRANQVHLNQETLPEDGNLTELNSLQLEDSSAQTVPCEDQYSAHLPSSFVQMLCSRGLNKKQFAN